MKYNEVSDEILLMAKPMRTKSPLDIETGFRHFAISRSKRGLALS